MPKIHLLFVAALFVLPLLVYAGDLRPTWLGLTGLYTLPTAESAPPHSIMLEYAEVRFQEQHSNKMEDVWFTGSLTYAPVARLEIAGVWRNEQISYGPINMPNYLWEGSQAYFIGDIKYQLVRPDVCKMGLAFGIIDVGNATRHVGNLDTGRGRREFLVATYKWADLAVTNDNDGVGAVAGARLPLTCSMDLLAEFSTRAGILC